MGYEVEECFDIKMWVEIGRDGNEESWVGIFSFLLILSAQSFTMFYTDLFARQSGKDKKKKYKYLGISQV